MSDKRHQIYEFNPTIYPFRLWVSVNPPFEDVKDKFGLLNNENERIGNSTTTHANPIYLKRLTKKQSSYGKE